MSRTRVPLRRSELAQFILVQCLREVDGSWSRVARRAARVGRTIVTRFWDPPVQVDIRGKNLFLPLSHDLPIYLATFPLYANNIALLAQVIERNSCNPTGQFMIDVGANVGDTAAIVSSRSSMPILCVEPHPDFGAYLEANRVQLEHVVAVEAVIIRSLGGSRTGRWETERGTAQFLDGPGVKPASATLSEIVERLPSGIPRVLKIDTDGHDLPIVESEYDFLAKWKPVLFFEYDPSFYTAETSFLEICEQLNRIGYETLFYFDNYGGYLGELDLADRSRVSEIDSYARTMSIRGDFLDVCTFHRDDQDLAQPYKRLVLKSQETLD